MIKKIKNQILNSLRELSVTFFQLVHGIEMTSPKEKQEKTS